MEKKIKNNINKQNFVYFQNMFKNRFKKSQTKNRNNGNNYIKRTKLSTEKSKEIMITQKQKKIKTEKQKKSPLNNIKVATTGINNRINKNKNMSNNNINNNYTVEQDLQHFYDNYLHEPVIQYVFYEDELYEQQLIDLEKAYKNSKQFIKILIDDVIAINKA